MDQDRERIKKSQARVHPHLEIGDQPQEQGKPDTNDAFNQGGWRGLTGDQYRQEDQRLPENHRQPEEHK